MVLALLGNGADRALKGTECRLIRRVARVYARYNRVMFYSMSQLVSYIGSGVIKKLSRLIQ